MAGERMTPTPVTVCVPIELPAHVLRAVRQNPLTSTTDKDEENRLIGWLLCAWDVIVIESSGGADAG